MAFIKYVTYDDAPPNLKKIYDRYGGRDKPPANIIRISSVNPPSMEGHVALYRGIMSPRSDLSRHRQEMIAVVISALNHCHY
jgi:hypothetical protein